MNRVKIAFVGIKGLPAIDGASRVVENIVSNLNKDRYLITIYADKNHKKMSIDQYGYKQIVIPSFPLFKNFSTFTYFLFCSIHALLFGKYDLIHLHNIDCAFMIPLLKLKYQLLCTSHGSNFAELGKWGKFARIYFDIMKKIFFKNSEYITYVSFPEYNRYKKYTRVKNYYIPNGININENINFENAKNILIKNNVISRFILFSAGRIIPIKGLHLLLNAYIRNGIDVKCVIIGDLNQTKDYSVKIKNLIKESNSIYLGFVRDKSTLLGIISLASIYVFPSLTENMSMMLLEVASVKTPIICSDIPENTAIFNNDEVLFFKSGDVHDLAEKLKWAISNHDEMRGKSLRAYNKVKEYYLWSKISKRYEKLYQKVLE